MRDEKQIANRKATLRRKVAAIKDMLTAEDVAELLHVGIRTAWRYDKEEKIPAPQKFGRMKRWKLSDIELWWELGCPMREDFEKQKKKG